MRKLSTLVAALFLFSAAPALAQGGGTTTEPAPSGAPSGGATSGGTTTGTETGTTGTPEKHKEKSSSSTHKKSSKKQKHHAADGGTGAHGAADAGM